jgi:hypothetical protein
MLLPSFLSSRWEALCSFKELYISSRLHCFTFHETVFFKTQMQWHIIYHMYDTPANKHIHKTIKQHKKYLKSQLTSDSAFNMENADGMKTSLFTAMGSPSL